VRQVGYLLELELENAELFTVKDGGTNTVT
jgi:hypothetical protein